MPSWVSIFFIGRHHNSVHSKKQHLRAYRSIDDCNQLQVPQISHGFPYLLIPMFVLGLWCNARRDPILTSWAMRHFLFSDCCHPSLRLRLRNRLQTVFNLSVKDCTSNGTWHTTIPTIGDVIKESAVTAAVDTPRLIYYHIAQYYSFALSSAHTLICSILLLCDLYFTITVRNSSIRPIIISLSKRPFRRLWMMYYHDYGIGSIILSYYYGFVIEEYCTYLWDFMAPTRRLAQTVLIMNGKI